MGAKSSQEIKSVLQLLQMLCSTRLRENRWTHIEHTNAAVNNRSCCERSEWNTHVPSSILHWTWESPFHVQEQGNTHKDTLYTHTKFKSGLLVLHNYWLLLLKRKKYTRIEQHQPFNRLIFLMDYKLFFVFFNSSAYLNVPAGLGS